MQFIDKKEKHNKINYSSLDKLEKCLGLLFNQTKTITICGYKITQNNSKVFPSYLMLYNDELSEYYFPVIDYADSVQNFLIYIANKLYKLIINNMNKQLYCNKIISDFENFKKDITVNGFKVFNNKIYLFMDLTKIKIN
jgi:hypothetical protein